MEAGLDSAAAGEVRIVAGAGGGVNKTELAGEAAQCWLGSADAGVISALGAALQAQTANLIKKTWEGGSCIMRHCFPSQHVHKAVTSIFMGLATLPLPLPLSAFSFTALAASLLAALAGEGVVAKSVAPQRRKLCEGFGFLVAGCVVSMLASSFTLDAGGVLVTEAM